MPRTARQPLVNLQIAGQPISAHKYLVSLEVVKQVGGWEGSLELFDPDWTQLEALVLEKGFNTPIQFTYGWEDQQSKTIEAKLSNYEPEFSQDGLRLTISWFLGTPSATRLKRNICWSTSMTISDIVRQIAEKNGWSYDIEPTYGQFDQPLVQDSTSDLYFIKNVLCPNAINLSGVGGYRFYFDANHKKCIFSTRGHNNKGILKSYIVQRDNLGEVISFAPADNVADIAILGGSKINVMGFDPKNKKILSAESSRSKSSNIPIDGGRVSSVVDDNDKGEVLRSISNKTIHSQEEAQRFSDIHYATFSQYNYSASADIIGDPDISLFGIYEFIVITSTGLVHYLSGSYQAMEIKDRISSSEFVTSIDLMRTSVSKGSEAIAGVKQRVVKIPTKLGFIQKIPGE